jgi:GNAT superfamily N-acetyltransferase
MPKRSGRKSVSQTPAPKSDKIYGSKSNPKGSASSEKSAKNIKLSEKTEKALKNKLSEFKEEHPNKKSVTLSDLKAVYRRGSGAYSKSHRPTITGGAPNSRGAWSYARVNKFLKKAGGAKVKAAYVQDDDLMAKGGVVELLGKIEVNPNGGADVSLWDDENNNVGYVDILYNKVENLLYAPSKLEGISKKDYLSDPQYKILTDDLKKYGIKPSDKIHYIEQIEIYEDFRGRGYASQALSDAIDFYKDEGVEFLLLTVGADTSDKGALSNKKLIDFYSRHGFKLLKGTGNYKNRMILDLKQNKLAKGGNTTFDIDNQDIRYADGGKTFNDKELLSKWKKGESIGFTGEAHLKAKGLIPRADGTKRKSEKYMANGGQTSQEINCVNCGWKWNTSDSDNEDMYLCHQCGFDNTLYYSDIMSKLKKPMSVSEISQKHGVTTEYIENQLNIGLKHELEHTDDEGVARIIALHHIGEKPNYYELVEKFKLEEGGQPSKFWHQADQYEISDFLKNEKMATEELLCSADTRIAKAIICLAKIDFAEQKEQKAHNLEEKNAWSAVKNIWEDCLKDIKTGVVYEYKDGGECGCMSYKDGGLAYGNSHDKGGMPLKVESTGQNIEIEGGEGVINKRSMQMSKKLDFQGKMLTPCQIVSKINEMGGGVKFKCQDVAEILAKDGNF